MKELLSRLVFVIFILVICYSLSPVIHEAGHMLTAQVFGITVKEFHIGAGKPFISWHIGNVEYFIKLTPFTGGVLLGEEFLDASSIAQVLIVFGGPLVNLLLFIFCVSWCISLVTEIRDSKIKKDILATEKYFLVLWSMSGPIRVVLWQIIRFFKKERAGGVSGPGGILESCYDITCIADIADIGGITEEFRKSWRTVAFYFSVCEMSLFVLSLLPVPLHHSDGGQICLIVYGAISGPFPLCSKFLLIGLILLLIFVIFMIVRDFFRVLKRLLI